MIKIVKKYLLVTLCLHILTLIIPAFRIDGTWYDIFYSSFILTLLLIIFKPIINLIMLPLNILTLNLSSWILNILIFYLWTRLVPNISISAWKFQGIKIGIISLSPMDFSYITTLIIVSILFIILVQIANWLFHKS